MALRVSLQFDAAGIPRTLGEIQRLQQGIGSIGNQRIEAGQFVALQQSMHITAAEAKALGEALNFPEAARAVQMFQSLQNQGLSTEQAFTRLNQELGITRDQFNAVGSGVANLQRFKVDGIIGFANSLKISYTAAQQFSSQMGLTATKAQAAVARIGQLKSVGATSAQQFAILKKELGLTRAQFDQLSTAANKAATATTNVKASGGGIKSAFASLTGVANGFNEILQAVMTLKAALVPAYNLLIGSNEKLNQELLKSQANLAANTRIFQNGVEITDVTEKIRATRGELEAAIKQVETDTLNLVGVTSSEVSTVFSILLQNTQALTNQSAQFADPISAAVESTKGWAATLGALGMPLSQARQEINSVLQGTIDMNSVLAKSLNITNPMVQEWKAQGVLVDKLNEKFATYVKANEEAARSVTGISSNIQDTFEIIAREAGKPLMEPLVASLEEFYNWFSSNKDEILAFTNEGISQFMEWANVISDQVMATLESLVPVMQAAFKFGKDELQRWLPVIGNVAAATGNIIQATAPVLTLLIKVGNFLRAMIMPALQSISWVVLKITEYIKLASTLTEPLLDFVGGQIERITGLIDKIPKNILNKIFGGGEGAAEAESSLNDVGAAAEDAAGAMDEVAGADQGLDLQSLELEDLGTAYDQMADKAASAQQTLESGAGGDLNKAKDAAKELMDLTQQQLELGQITEEEAIKRLESIANNTQLSYEEQLAAQKQLQELQTKALEDQAQEAIDAAKFAETERNNIIKQGLVDGTISQREANEQQLQSTRERIQAELAAEQEKLAALAALPDGEEKEKKIRESKQRTADLSGQLLDNEISMQEALQDRIIQGIKDQLAEKERAHDRAVAGVEREIAANEKLAKSLELQKQLMAAKNNLAKAQSDLAQTGTNIELTRIERALELQQQLSDENLKDGEYRKALESELQSLGVGAGEDRVTLLQRQQALEDKLAAQKLAALHQEQAQQRASLELDIQSNQLAAQRAVLQAKINQMEADFAKIKAQSALAEAKALKDKEERERAVNEARHQIELAQQGIELAQQGVEMAEEELGIQDDLASLQRETLATQQEAALTEAQSAEAMRELAQNTDLAKAKSEERVAVEERNKAAIEAQAQLLDQQTAAKTQQIELSKTALQGQIAVTQSIQKSLENQAALLDAQAKAAQAKFDAALAQSESQVSILDRAIALRQKLEDGQVKSAEERREIERELAALGARGDSAKLIKKKKEEEQKIAQIKVEAQASEHAHQIRSLELDIQKRAIAADMAVMQAQMAVNDAEIKKIEAEADLVKAQADGDAAKIAAAQQVLEITKQQVAMAEQGVAGAMEQKAALAAIAQEEREALAYQQQAEKTKLATELKMKGAAEGFNSPTPRPTPGRSGSGMGQRQNPSLSPSSNNNDVVAAIGGLRRDLQGFAGAAANNKSSVTNNYLSGGTQAGLSSNTLRNSLARAGGI